VRRHGDLLSLRASIGGVGDRGRWRGSLVLLTFTPARRGLLPGVDLEDREFMADLLDGDGGHAAV
jgi:hypothetical protein